MNRGRPTRVASYPAPEETVSMPYGGGVADADSATLIVV